MKMHKHIYFLLAFAAILTLQSCESFVNVDIPEQHKKIVVYSFISPQDSLIRVQVFQSNPLFNTNFDYNPTLPDSTAMVKLSDGVNEVLIPYNSQEEKYVISSSMLPIIPGHSYQLTVASNNLEPVHATTTVPLQQVHFTSTNITSIINTNPNDYSYRYRLDSKWQDLPGEENYYALYVFDRYAFEDSLYPYDNIFEVYRNYYSDKGYEGNLIEVSADIHASNVGWSPEVEAIREFRVYLLTCTSDYYHYHRSLMNAENSGNDPFSEPTITHSNIENGLGCFASFNGYSIAIPY